MRLPFTSQIGLAVIAVCMIVSLVCLEHRLSLFAYVGLYIGGIFLMLRITSPQVLISMGLTGVMNAVILSVGSLNLHQPFVKPIFSTKFFFRTFLGVIWAILVFSIEEKIAEWLPVPDSLLYASFLTFGAAFFIICLERDYVYTFLGLLSIFYAFQMIYMLLEGSILVFGFLTLISQMIAFIGAIFILQPNQEEKKDNL